MRLLANKQNNDPRPLAHFRIRTDPYIYIYIYIYIIKKKKKKIAFDQVNFVQNKNSNI
jgi:hypothetical protein